MVLDCESELCPNQAEGYKEVAKLGTLDAHKHTVMWFC